MKILVAIDGSPQALAALERLVGKFGFFRDTPRLTLIHVHPPVPYKAAAAWVGKEAVARYYAEESEAALARRARLPGGARHRVRGRASASAIPPRRSSREPPPRTST